MCLFLLSAVSYIRDISSERFSRAVDFHFVLLSAWFSVWGTLGSSQPIIYIWLFLSNPSQLFLFLSFAVFFPPFILSAYLKSISSGFVPLFQNLILISGCFYPFLLKTFLNSINLLLSFSSCHLWSPPSPPWGVAHESQVWLPPSPIQIPRPWGFEVLLGSPGWT